LREFGVSFSVAVTECSDVGILTAAVTECSDAGLPTVVVPEYSDAGLPLAAVTMVVLRTECSDAGRWDELAMYHFLHLNFHQ
jgi:hypothetical protein